ncbi:MAG: hypothetical protein ACO38V_12690 [Phycisphaerales bacterium]
MTGVSGWWPQWFPPDLRLPFRTQLAIHWRANLLMLRSPAAVAGFCGWSFLPLVPLLAGAWAAGWFTGEPRGLSTPAGLSIYGVAVLAYLLLQHLAFVRAIDRTYLPFVRDALRLRGIPVCRACGHRLAPGATRCPECGLEAAAATTARP